MCPVRMSGLCLQGRLFTQVSGTAVGCFEGWARPAAGLCVVKVLVVRESKELGCRVLLPSVQNFTLGTGWPQFLSAIAACQAHVALTRAVGS